MKGMLVGGANSNLDDPYAKDVLAGKPAAKCYVDNIESYSTNEVAIYWNSPFVYLLAGILAGG
jgi:endoglucanase